MSEYRRSPADLIMGVCLAKKWTIDDLARHLQPASMGRARRTLDNIIEGRVYEISVRTRRRLEALL